MTNKVKKDVTVVLVDTKFNKYFINTGAKTDKYKGVGVVNPADFVGMEYGKKTKIKDKEFWIFKPSLMDKLQGLKRKAQVILPRDSAHIIINCSIESGHVVLEAGIGSGSLTIALSNAVAPNGKVISYELREDFIEHALKNLRTMDMDKFVLIKNKDVTQGIDEKDLDAVILDMHEGKLENIPPLLSRFPLNLSRRLSRMDREAAEMFMRSMMERIWESVRILSQQEGIVSYSKARELLGLDKDEGEVLPYIIEAGNLRKKVISDAEYALRTGLW